jgi:hypothetical protein
MKRKIALVLAAVMTTAMLPMNAMAGSTNTVSKSVSVKTDEALISSGKPVELQIQPRNEIETGDSIIISVENGKFDRSFVEDAYVTINGETVANPFIYRSNKTSTTYDAIASTGLSTYDALVRYVGNENSRQLPYGFRYVNENELEVKLFPIEDAKVNQNNSDVTQGTPIYSIALPISTEDSTEDEDIKITIDDNGTSVTGGSTYVVGKVVDDSGSTTASVVSSDITVSSADTIYLPDITIKEDVADTFGTGKITIRTNGSYEFDTTVTAYVTAGVNASFTSITGTYSSNAKEFTFNIGDGTGEIPLSSFDDSKLSSIVITGLAVTTDNDSTYGDINVTVSGASNTNVTRQTIKVAERRDYGFNLVALEEVPTMYSGRTFLKDAKTGADNDYDQDDFTTAEFRFSETTPDTWLTSRKLELTVPDGVKIVGADITKTKYVTKPDSIRNNLAIANDGQTLRINAIGNGVLNDNESSEIEFELYLVADPTFTGDVTVSASGAGLDADTLSPITVAKFVSPITIESAVTKTNIGYQAVKTADIKIVENAVAALAEDEDVEISIDSLYGENELGFADNNASIEVSGELEVKNFKVSNGAIKFTVDSESYNNPATVTISDIEVGTTRSIPYGSYDLLVAGDAVVNNYLDDIDVNYPINNINGSLDPETLNEPDSTVSSYYPNYGFDKFDDNEGFEFKGYFTVATETGTLDKKVEVTIGASTIKVDGEDVAMDAAAYIQTSSNSTMVPLRFVSVALGVDSDNVTSADESSKIMWDNTNKTATIAYAAGNGQKLVQFTAGSPVMKIDGTEITMENGVVAEIVDGRMYVPFRALGQALGVPVSWDADTRTAIYNA